MGQWTTSDR